MVVDDQAGLEPGAEPPYGPRWVIPNLYGLAEALNSMGTIAAPLLGGFSLAAMVQTLTINTTEARWPDAAFLLFMLAAVLFVATVQAMFWARQYQTNPTEIKGWWPDATKPQRVAQLRQEQRRHAAGFRMWSNRARITYSAALLCLLAALMVLAVPHPSHGQTPVLRWLAVAVGAAAFITEAIWITGSFTNASWLQPPVSSWLQPSVDNSSDASSDLGP